MSLVHCSKSQRSYSAPAPVTADQLGFIVKASRSQIDAIAEAAPQARIRTINASQGIFEVAMIDTATLQELLPNQTLYKNEFLKGVSESEEQLLSLEVLAMNTSPDAIAALQTCQPIPTAPKLDIEVDFDRATMTVELGQSVTLTATGTPNEIIGGDVRVLWDMLPPGFSTQSFQTGITGSQTFTPDSLGLYQIAVIGQGADLACSLTVVHLMVTANPEPSQDLQLAVSSTSAVFKHLNDVKARVSWNQTRGKDVVVAVLDSGVHYNHPGLRNNIKFKDTDSVDGVDTDNNSLKDDFMGWDFINNDNLPFDDNGHGTHVAGLIASPLSGVAPDAKILPIKILDASGSSDVGSFIAGIFYAVDSGANIINASLEFGGPAAPQLLIEAIEYARKNDVLLVVASGNGDRTTGIGYDISARSNWPASIQKDNMMGVAATALGNITDYSNFSKELIHVAAPGGSPDELILSLTTLNPVGADFAAEMGTSMATPIVSGVAALIWAAKPDLTPAEIRKVLMDTGDELPSLTDKTISGRQVNAAAALSSLLDLKLDLNLASAMN